MNYISTHIKALRSLIRSPSFFLVILLLCCPLAFAKQNNWFFEIKSDEVRGEAAIAGIYEKDELPPSGIFVLCRFGEFMVSISNEKLSDDLYAPVRYKVDGEWSNLERWRVNHKGGNKMLISESPEKVARALMKGKRVIIEIEDETWSKDYLEFSLEGARSKVKRVIEFCSE